VSDVDLNWWDTYEVADFGRWLDSNGYFAHPCDALDYHEAPWKWQGEHEVWQAEMRNEGLEEAA
jgi:hypothetical protein